MVEVGTPGSLRRVDQLYPAPEIDLAASLHAAQELSKIVFSSGVDLAPGYSNSIDSHYWHFRESLAETDIVLPPAFPIGKAKEALREKSGMQLRLAAFFLGEIALAMPIIEHAGASKFGIATIAAEMEDDPHFSLNISYHFYANGYTEADGEMGYSQPNEVDGYYKSPLFADILLRGLGFENMLPTLLNHPDDYLLFDSVQVGAEQVSSLITSSLTDFS